MKTVFFSNAIWDKDHREAALQKCRNILHDGVEDINAELFRGLLPESTCAYDLSSVEHPERLRTMFTDEAYAITSWVCGWYEMNRTYSDLIYMIKGWNDHDNKHLGNFTLAISLIGDTPIIFEDGAEPTNETVEYFQQKYPVVLPKLIELMNRSKGEIIDE